MFRRIANCFVPAPYLQGTPMELIQIKIISNSFGVSIESKLLVTPRCCYRLDSSHFHWLKSEIICRQLPWCRDTSSLPATSMAFIIVKIAGNSHGFDKSKNSVRVFRK